MLAVETDLTKLTTPSLLWAQFQSDHAATIARESLNRSDSFFDDVAVVVAGEPARLMVPDDLLTLDRLRNPLVCGGKLGDLTSADIQQFLWVLSPERRGTLLDAWRLGRFRARMDKRHRDDQTFGNDVDELVRYIDGIFQDAPATSTTKQADELREKEGHRRPIGAHFLATILVPLSTDVGQCDPFDGRAWQFTPLPRIFQYLKVARFKTGSQEIDDSPSRVHESAWLAAVNEARRNGILVGESGIPGSRGLEHISAAEVAAARN